MWTQRLNCGFFFGELRSSKPFCKALLNVKKWQTRWLSLLLQQPKLPSLMNLSFSSFLFKNTKRQIIGQSIIFGFSCTFYKISRNAIQLDISKQLMSLFLAIMSDNHCRFLRLTNSLREFRLKCRWNTTQLSNRFSLTKIHRSRSPRENTYNAAGNR